jgi:hypothetical protein
VIVLDQGHDKEKLEGDPVRAEDESICSFVLTPGIWPSLWSWLPTMSPGMLLFVAIRNVGQRSRLIDN